MPAPTIRPSRSWSWTRNHSNCSPTPEQARRLRPSGWPARTPIHRCGTCSIFVWAEPLRGWRRAYAESTRTRIDWAHGVEHLLNVDYPDADKVVLVMDNLNTHSDRLPLRGIPAREGLRPGRPAGDPPHTQARLLAQHRRDRTVLPDQAMPRPAYRRPRTSSTPNSPPGPRPSTPTSAKSTGGSPPATPASNYGTYTQLFRSDRLLVSFGPAPQDTGLGRNKTAGCPLVGQLSPAAQRGLGCPSGGPGYPPSAPSTMGWNRRCKEFLAVVLVRGLPACWPEH